MFLNKIKLKNIRSYVNQEINFPKGTTLLSGDIGSGKSTILLAIEFVLFGLKRGSGEGLLRNGVTNGFVELDFDLDGKKVLIKRKLKRSKGKVSQGTGLLNGEGLSATELKQRVLELLNYPKEMLTKDSLIYRYTVYTPQEEMKFILLGDKDLRLDTLRKVFGIDKYKRIRENSAVFNSFLRGRIKELDGRIFDLKEKEKEFSLEQKELDEKNILFDKIKPLFEKINVEVDNFKNKIVSLELSVKSLNNFKNKLEVCKSKLEQDEKLFSENKEKLNEIKIIEIDENKVKVLEEEVLSLRNSLSELNVKLKHSEEVKEKILSLDTCPTCEQKVDTEYKSRVKWREEDNIKNHIIKLKETNEILELKEKEFSEVKKIDNENKSNLRLRNDLNDKNKFLENEMIELKQDINDFEDDVKRLGGVESEYDVVKKELDILINKLRETEVEKVRIESDISNCKIIISKLESEIEEKLKCKFEKEKWIKIQFFIKEQFLELMQTMEKQIMFKVHGDFNSLFGKWFNMIIGSELLNVHLDDEFSPMIEQNKHEIDYGFLSGGEKTAIALAYRLALNQVINSLISDIKTKDLLILDEPTDGFSSEQLDKVRDVLDELNIGQVIMVSHNEKVEGFVENVLRLSKEDHVSNVI